MDQSPTEKVALLIGQEGLERLQKATVMVLGLGGVGSNCMEMLARGGIGHLIGLDHDLVSLSNINRQAIAFHSTVGQPKIAVMAAMIHDINPAIQVDMVSALLSSANAIEILSTSAASIDYLVDCIDAISVKLTIAAWAQNQPFSLISSMGAANKVDPAALRVADLYETVNDPMARIMRKEGRKRGIEHLKVVYSAEPALHRPIPENTDRRARLNLGTMPYMPALMGQFMASAVIREIALGSDHAL